MLFKWVDSGWAVGVLGKPNTSSRYKVDGVVANFRAKYDVDGKTASHVLSLTGYAADAGAEDESWVLLGPAEEAPALLGLEQRSVQPKTTTAPLQPTHEPTVATPGKIDDATLSAMSPADQAALMVRLGALLSGVSSPSDAAPPPA